MFSLRDYWIAVVLDNDERECLHIEAEAIVQEAQERIQRQQQERRELWKEQNGVGKKKWHPMDCVHGCGCTLQ